MNIHAYHIMLLIIFNMLVSSPYIYTCYEDMNRTWKNCTL